MRRRESQRTSTHGSCTRATTSRRVAHNQPSEACRVSAVVSAAARTKQRRRGVVRECVRLDLCLRVSAVRDFVCLFVLVRACVYVCVSVCAHVCCQQSAVSQQASQQPVRCRRSETLHHHHHHHQHRVELSSSSCGCARHIDIRTVRSLATRPRAPNAQLVVGRAQPCVRIRRWSVVLCRIVPCGVSDCVCVCVFSVSRRVREPATPPCLRNVRSRRRTASGWCAVSGRSTTARRRPAPSSSSSSRTTRRRIASR